MDGEVASGMELYRSSNLCVRKYPGTDETVWAVTFDDYGSARGLDRDGFGHGFFESRGISHITVLATGPHWYNYLDMREALVEVSAATVGAHRIMTYGSSMGGYAALRFATHVGATTALALSPQYSIDPARVPFDMRWLADGRQIDWQDWIEAPIRLPFRPLIISSGGGEDARHVRMIAEETAIDHVMLNHTAHPVTTFLSSVSLLEEAVLGTLDGTLDLSDFRRRAEKARRTDPIYLGELGRLQPDYRNRTGLTLAYRALGAAPDNPLVHNNLALRLRASGRLTDALEHHRQAAALSGGAPAYEIERCATLQAVGNKELACAIASRLALQEPTDAHLLAWAAQLHWKCGNLEAALGYAEGARHAAPKSEYFAQLWKDYRRRSMPWRHRFLTIVERICKAPKNTLE